MTGVYDKKKHSRRHRKLTKKVHCLIESGGDDIVMATIVGAGMVVLGEFVYNAMLGKNSKSSIGKIAQETLQDLVFSEFETIKAE